ncbi:universal stress protein [Streptomyces sp. NRRL S-118]|uniref:universal stress protein n=1 Tax=Streptomyces sp. NRRL S-118 TaxID=1463881 RepID=UPI0006935090|nr:universal stress protein [Streptomyces sp. NRRL S-118]
MTAGITEGVVGLSVVGTARHPVVFVRNTATAEQGRPGEVAVGPAPGRTARPLPEFAFREAALRESVRRVVHAWHAPVEYGRAEVLDPGLVHEVGAGTAGELTAARRKRLPAVRVRAEPVVVPPGSRLVDAAADPGLLVFGRRSRAAPAVPRVGPVAHAVLHHAATPVAVVPHAPTVPFGPTRPRSCS